MIRFNKKGVAEVIEFLFVILLIIFMILAFVFTLFFEPIPYEDKVDADFYYAKDQYLLRNILSRDIYHHGKNTTIADFIRDYDVTGDYENELICLFYKWSTTPNSFYVSYELKVEKEGDTMHHKSQLDDYDRKYAEKNNQVLFTNKPLVQMVIPAESGPIIIQFRSGAEYLHDNNNYMPVGYLPHLEVGLNECEKVKTSDQSNSLIGEETNSISETNGNQNIADEGLSDIPLNPNDVLPNQE